MKYTTTITSKGTICLPADLRQQLGMNPSMVLSVEVNNDGNIELKKPLDLSELQKITKEHLKKNSIKPFTNEELDEAINSAWGEGVAVRYKRSLK